MVDTPTDTEIANLHVSLAVQQDVVKLDISMHNANRVHVRDPLHDLLKEILGILFCQFSPLSHVVKKIAARAKFHHNQVVLRCLECLQQLNVTRVLYRLQYVDLLHHLALRTLLLYLVFIRRLYRHELPGQAMQAKIYLTKGAFSKNLADFVQFDSCLWHLVVLLEAVCDDFGEQGNLTRSWTHSVRSVLTCFLLHLLDH